MAEFSAYFGTLSPEIQLRYKEKIKDIGGIDPYLIKKSEWSTDLSKLPEITWPDLVIYLVFGVNEFTINLLKLLKVWKLIISLCLVGFGKSW